MDALYSASPNTILPSDIRSDSVLRETLRTFHWFIQRLDTFDDFHEVVVQPFPTSNLVYVVDHKNQTVVESTDRTCRFYSLMDKLGPC